MLPQFPGAYTMPSDASNEWAVDGRHTATRRAAAGRRSASGVRLSRHLVLARIDMPGRVLAGATAPGVPFLVLGHNGKIAWTFTTTGADVQDIFIETPAGPGEYQTPGRAETIRGAGGTDQGSRPGGRVADGTGNPAWAGDQRPGPSRMARSWRWRWAICSPNDTAAAGLLALNRAESVQEAGAAAAEITSPVQNLLVADAKTIGLFVTGRVPIRKAGDGSAPVPGDGSHDWVGWASGEQLPHSVVTGERPDRERQRASLAARFSGVHGPRHVRPLAGEPDPGTAGPIGPPYRGGFRRHAGRRRRHVRRQVLPTLLALAGRHRTRRSALWSAARLGRIGSDGFARAADLQRLDERLLRRRAAPCGPDARCRRAGLRLRGLRAVTGRRALV